MSAEIRQKKKKDRREKKKETIILLGKEKQGSIERFSIRFEWEQKGRESDKI